MRSRGGQQAFLCTALCLLLVLAGLALSGLFVFSRPTVQRRPSVQPVVNPHLSMSVGPPSNLQADEGTKTERTAGETERQTEGARRSEEEELVRPVKVWPLAPRGTSELDSPQAWQPTPHELRHHDTGHYRGMFAQIWDPHPRYEFRGLGRLFRLDLRPSKSVVRPGIKVLHVFENHSRVEDPKLNTQGCIYTGKVIGDPNSVVSVSLCHGMSGHIWTSDGSYTIEPAEKWKGPSEPILHRLSRLPKIHHSCSHEDGVIHMDDMVEDGEMSQQTGEGGRTRREAPEEEDDSSAWSLEETEATHRKTKRRKRWIEYEYMDVETVRLNRSEFERTNEWEEDDDRREKRRAEESEEAWLEEEESSGRVRRSAHREYTIELMVVVDMKMKEFYGEDLDHYIINLIAAVDQIFKDPSIGNAISIALVQYNVMQVTDWGNQTAPYMLKKFCDWQHRFNTIDDTLPEHYDAAIFLTRERLCRPVRHPPRSRNCDSIGLAEVGGICKDNGVLSCAIVKDVGLSTVFTIAHELGHVLNLPHDSMLPGSRCHRFMKEWDKPYLMASILGSETRPWSWSNCSRHLLTEFLEDGQGWCLLDTPAIDHISDREHERQLLGEMFNLDKQCEFVYGKGYKLCPRLTACDELWCQDNSSDTCSTTHVPWADGTPCGENMWCQKRQCVYKKRLRPIDGGWSPWKRIDNCSRECGGGVRISVRECNNPIPANGGKYCLGDRVRYHSCNVHDCPPGTKDFRELQCAAFNNNNFNLSGLSRLVKWFPKYDGISPDERCKLYCRDPETKHHYALKEKVIDGTGCGPNTFDICVNGVCKPAGCDHILHSKKQLDRCGQCGGDNSTCKVISGSYNTTQHGYSRICTIPSGASYIEVRQHGYLNSNKDNNYLALFDSESREYILNGNNTFATEKKLILYGGSTVEYTGSEETVERIHIARPLTRDLEIRVFSHGTLFPPDVTYEYVVPKQSLYQYTWGLSNEWTPCDKVCNGTSWQVHKCFRVDGWHEFSPQLCDELEKGSEMPSRSCNTHCNLEWRAVSRSECSSECGPGYRTIKFECVVEENRISSHTDENACWEIPRPQDTEPCVGECVEVKWAYDPWTECSKSCGTGVRTRTARCVDSNKRERNTSECISSNLKTQELCNTQECPTWKVGKWSACSVTCGGGIRHRPFWCWYNGREEGIEKCPLPKPVIKESCNDDPCAHWIEDAWSECSVTCGTGVETRNVSCSIPNACSNSTRPLTSRPCYQAKCSLGHENAIYNGDSLNKYSWRHKWSECSVTCGIGQTRSTIKCYDNVVEKETDFKNCAGQFRPAPSFDFCYMPNCPRWVVSDWEPCSAICGSGTQSKRIYCESHNGLMLPDSACPVHTRPAREEKRCSIVCPQRTNGLNEWITYPWSQCSVSCGTGVRVRKVLCEGQCHGPKPHATTSCNAEPCADEGFWNAGNWSECSATCGEGTQERQIRCESQEGEILPESYCSGTIPSKKQKCVGSPCKPFFKWEVTRWSPCSARCGKGIRKRYVECKSTKGERVRDELCEGRKPKTDKNCKKTPCLYDWDEGKWSQCSSSCGQGVQSRKVRCVKNFIPGKARKDAFEVDQSFCNPKTRPEHKKLCRGYCNNGYKWEAGVWHPCDKPCSKKGKQKRNLYCYHGKKKVSRKHCPKELRPERRRKCETIQCPSCRALQEGFNERRDGEYQLWVQGKNVSIYCYNMQDSHPKEYITLPGDNYAEIFSTSIRHPSRCLRRSDVGRTATDYCESDWGQAPYGFTFFTKVHINISSFLVDSSDWTFATTMKGSPVGYGEAGDCHTRGLCPEGKFTINLYSTGFRVSPVTTWVGLGEQHAPPNIEIFQDGQKVMGRCGGCCGFCKPRNGLKLDLLPP